jgi:hypothetical protein
MIICVFASFLFLIPVFLFFNEKFNNPLYPLFNFFNTSTTASSVEHFAYNPDPFYFLKNLASYISINGIFHFELFFILILILIIGILLYFYNIISFELKKIRINEAYSILKNESANKKIRISLFIGIFLIFVLTFDKTTYILSELLFFVLSYFIYTFLKDIECIDIDLLFLSWFMVYFIFHSVFAIKVDRYFISMAPAFIFFVILGLNEISGKFKVKVRNINLIPLILSLILIIMVLAPTISWIEHNYSISKTSDSQYEEVKDSIAASQWLIANDPNYKTKNIYSDYLWPHLSWYLKTNVKPIPLTETRSINYELSKYDIDYYFINNFKLNSTSYKKINQFGNITVYKKF